MRRKLLLLFILFFTAAFNGFTDDLPAPGSTLTYNGHSLVVLNETGVTNDDVRIRTGPSTDYDYVMYREKVFEGPEKEYEYIPKNRNVFVIGRTQEKMQISEWYNYWYLIEMTDADSLHRSGERVWAYGEFIDIAKPREGVPEGFVLVEAGSFTMGSPPSEEGRYDTEIQHTVNITRDYYISTYEVTQAEYQSIMGNNPSDTATVIGDTYPVNNVTWYGATEYCNKRSGQEGLMPCYSGSGESIRCDFSANGYRLPTEAEWEYAARGGNENRGYIYSGSNDLWSVAWYWENAWLWDSETSPNPVGLKQANELGIYDMSGNVDEWCWDWYGDYPTGSVTDPTGPSSGSYRVNRGGGWNNNAGECRLAYRNLDDPSRRYYAYGFRLVRLP